METITLPELLERARSLTGQSRRTILGIVGPPGAGKSTVCDALLAGLGNAAALVPMDGFHLDNQVLIDLGRRQRKGAPDTFDVGAYAALLDRLRSNSEPVVYAPRFDRNLELAIASSLPVPRDASLVITEGNYLLHDEHGWDVIRPKLDEVWSIAVDDDEIRRRLLARRLATTDETEQQALAWVTGVDEPNARLVKRNLDQADLVIDLVLS